MGEASDVRRVVEAPVRGGPLVRSEIAEWRERSNLVAGITERGAGGDFSLGLTSEEPVGRVMGRWRAFAQAMRPHFRSVVMASQVHGATVRWHERVQPGWHLAEEGDGHAAADAGVLVAVTVADCVPVYLAGPEGVGFALLHAGWRGIAAGVLERGVALLAERLAVAPSELVVHLGVAICGACYEVGPEVVAAVTGRGADGPQRLDLRRELLARARSVGVGEVTVSPACTACEPERFFSHRASGGAHERMLAYLGRPAAGA
jgi:YfiH family protein